MTDKKERELEKQLKREPTNVALRLQLAALYESTGRRTEAVDQYREVALTYRDEGRTQQALAVARSALGVAPEDPVLKRLVAELGDRVTGERAAVPTPVPAPPPVAQGSRPGVRVLDAPVPVREIEPVRVATPRVRPEPQSGPTAASLTPSGVTPSRPSHGLFTPTPLPPPLAYHDADPSRIRGGERSSEKSEPVTIEKPASRATPTAVQAEGGDTVPESVHAGLSAAARRISERLVALSGPLLDGEDVAGDLDTRRLPKIEPAAVDHLAQPPTLQIPKIDLPDERDEELTSPSSEPGFAAPHVARTVGRLDEDAWTEEPTDPRDAEDGSGLLGPAVGDTTDGLLPDGTPLGPATIGALGPEVRNALVAAGKPRTVPAGGTLVNDGDAGDSLFVILSGEVKVVKQIAPRPPVEVARLAVGAIVGEMAVLTDRRRHATVEAVTTVRVTEIDRAAIAHVAEQHPTVATLLDELARERMVSNLLLLAPFFAPIAPDDRAAVLERFKSRKVKAETEVIEQGEAPRGLFVVLLGTLELTVRRRDGARVTIATLGEGAHVGELALLEEEPEGATATAKGPCELVVLPAADFYKVVSDYPKLWTTLRGSADALKAQLAAALR